MLAEWRNRERLTKLQVAARMGVKLSVISRIENNVTKVSINTLVRYANACGVKNPIIQL